MKLIILQLRTPLKYTHTAYTPEMFIARNRMATFETKVISTVATGHLVAAFRLGHSHFACGTLLCFCTYILHVENLVDKVLFFPALFLP
jgi:hypothetical protein